MCRIRTMTSRCSLHEWFYLFSRILDPGSPFFYSSQQLLRGAGYSSRPVHSIQSQGSCLNTFNKPSLPDTSKLIPGGGRGGGIRPWAQQYPVRTQVVGRTLPEPRGILFEPNKRLLKNFYWSWTYKINNFKNENVGE